MSDQVSDLELLIMRYLNDIDDPADAPTTEAVALELGVTHEAVVLAFDRLERRGFVQQSKVQ